MYPAPIIGSQKFFARFENEALQTVVRRLEAVQHGQRDLPISFDARLVRAPWSYFKNVASQALCLGAGARKPRLPLKFAMSK
jgi:hypothetical protein